MILPAVPMKLSPKNVPFVPIWSLDYKKVAFSMLFCKIFTCTVLLAWDTTIALLGHYLCISISGLLLGSGALLGYNCDLTGPYWWVGGTKLVGLQED